jgi:hypothetical protein
MHEWEHLCDVDVCEWVHDRVEEIVNKDYSYDSTGRLLILCFGVVCTRACPTRKNGGHADESDKVLRPTIEHLGEEGGRHTGDKIPAGQSEVDLVLLTSVHNADCGQYLC